MTDLSGIASLIDGDFPADELIAADNGYSALANEAHRLRLENDRLRVALVSIATILKTLEKT